MELREYQQAAITRIVESAKYERILKQVIVLATGLGKTVIFSHLPQRVKERGKKTLILAHREELLGQAKKKIEAISPTLTVGIEQGENNVEDVMAHDVIVASVPTLGRSGSKRIEKFKPTDFGLIVVDECHHATSETYRNIFRHFGVLKGDLFQLPTVLLGVTATPNRSDHVGLDNIFDAITFTYTLKDGIDNGYLSPIKAFTVATKTDISQVATRAGDFAENELSEAVNNQERNRLVVETYKEKFNNTKALVFASSVEHVNTLVELFKNAKVRAEGVIGATDKDVREAVLRDFDKGDLDVLVNCNVLTEGYDCPSIDTILMTRPTKSSVLYSQMIGRGTRLSPDTGKQFLNLVDFVDNVGKNKVVTLPSIFGVPKMLNLKGGKLINEVLEKIDKIKEVNPDFDVEKIDDWSDESIDKIVKEVNIFAQASIPEEVQQHSKFSWERDGDGFKLSVPPTADKKSTLIIRPNLLSQWELVEKVYNKVPPARNNGYTGWLKKEESVKILGKDQSEIFSLSDDFLSKEFPQQSQVFRQDGKWRKDEPSEKQLKMLSKFKVPIPEGLTKGQASVLIGKAINERNSKKRI